MERITIFCTILLLAAITSACETITDLFPFAQPATVPATESRNTVETTQTPSSLIDVPTTALNSTTIHVWHSFMGPAASLFSAQLSEFNSSNEWNITIEQTPAPDYRTLFEEVTSALENNTLPDMVVVPPEFALNWQDNVTDLTPYVNDTKYGFSEADIGDFPAVFWQQDEVNGFRLGVPAQRTARLMVQNQTWAGELGISSIPDDGESFREQACAGNQDKRKDAILSNDGYGGWVVDDDLYISLSWLIAFKGSVVEGEKYRFSEPANEETLVFLKQLFDDNCSYISTEPLSYTPLINRSALFTTVGLGELPDVARAFEINGSSDVWSVMAFPGKKTALVPFGPSYTIFQSTSEKQLAAWLFIRWLLTPENQARWVEKTGLFPLRTSSLELLSDYRANHPQWEAAVDLLPAAQSFPQLASWYRVKYILGDGVFSIYRMDTPVEEIPNVLKDMDSLVEELLDD